MTLSPFTGAMRWSAITRGSLWAHGVSKIGSLRGTSSHQYNPAVILAERETTETAGGCYAMSFVYSGGFQSEAGMDQYYQTRLLMGLCEEQFAYSLEAGEEFRSPEVILSYSSEGIGKLSQNLHRCMRGHLCRGKYKESVRSYPPEQLGSILF